MNQDLITFLSSVAKEISLPYGNNVDLVLIPDPGYNDPPLIEFRRKDLVWRRQTNLGWDYEPFRNTVNTLTDVLGRKGQTISTEPFRDRRTGVLKAYHEPLKQFRGGYYMFFKHATWGLHFNTKDNPVGNKGDLRVNFWVNREESFPYELATKVGHAMEYLQSNLEVPDIPVSWMF